MQFEKGQSGNPAGRRPGSKNKSTLMAQALFEGEAEELMRTAVSKAREGDSDVGFRPHPLQISCCLQAGLPPVMP